MSDNISLDEILLPADMQWTDEFGWSVVRQNVTTSVTGAQIVQMNSLQSGRPITLEGVYSRGSTDNYAVVSRATVNLLKAKEISALGTPMTLTFSDGRTYQVIFRYDSSDNAVDATATKPIDPPLDDDLYLLKLRLMTV